ncbi:hypothetical protein GCM10009716_06540 [Streptomyces sodiiphilus]|uniref:Uncharacterized protein n=1 Tax=Streptomyces sodiiphilus TaxID=226217 RepID=A0ABN2NRP7_9ACTN
MCARGGLRANDNAFWDAPNNVWGLGGPRDSSYHSALAAGVRTPRALASRLALAA